MFERGHLIHTTSQSPHIRLKASTIQFQYTVNRRVTNNNNKTPHKINPAHIDTMIFTKMAIAKTKQKASGIPVVTVHSYRQHFLLWNLCISCWADLESALFSKPWSTLECGHICDPIVPSEISPTDTLCHSEIFILQWTAHNSLQNDANMIKISCLILL